MSLWRIVHKELLLSRNCPERIRNVHQEKEPVAVPAAGPGRAAAVYVAFFGGIYFSMTDGTIHNQFVWFANYERMAQ